MAEPRTIKKYPNRRLYDTEESRYITLSDIRKLVNDQVEFVVIEKKTGNDITCQILLQVITEQETHGNTVLNRNFLSQIINSYGSNVQGMVGGYLEQSMNMFMNQRKQMRERIKNVLDLDPTGIATKNYSRWLSLQDEVLSKFKREDKVKEEEQEVKGKE